MNCLYSYLKAVIIFYIIKWAKASILYLEKSLLAMKLIIHNIDHHLVYSFVININTISIQL